MPRFREARETDLDLVIDLVSEFTATQPYPHPLDAAALARTLSEFLASPALDFQLSDSYFVVAHFHYVVFGTVVFAMFAGYYFWWPKLTGRMLDERLGKIHFWTLFIGFHTTFLVQHWLGVEGMPRRYADYLPTDGWTTLNMVSTIGAYILGLSMLPFMYNAWRSWVGKNERVVGDDPWGYGNSLEWATSCPPPPSCSPPVVRTWKDSARLTDRTVIDLAKATHRSRRRDAAGHA